MTLYERLLDIDEATFHRLTACGLARPNARRDLLLYASYLDDLPRCGSMQAICNASERFFLSEERARQIIYQLRKALPARSLSDHQPSKNPR